MYFKYIILRREYRQLEYRTPLIPTDCKKIIQNNMIVYVEKDSNRCYSDTEYIENGCIMINNYDDLLHNDMLIVGLKEFDYNLNYVFNYNHLYFSHTFKNQSNSNYILQRFKAGGGSIYDLEYFTDSNNKRLFAFGFHAGIAGCYLGLLQYYYKKQYKNINKIKPFNSYNQLFNHIYSEYIDIYIQPDIAIIGNGRCAQGVIYLLNQLNLSYTIYTKDINKDNLHNYNIIFNCILLTTHIDPFITNNMVKLFKDPTVIVDISCDYNNINNPIPIYSQLSNFNEPIIKINKYVDVIAIDNLPSLLARNSSSAFSAKLINLFIDTDKSSWRKNIAIYRDKIDSLN
jgi:saccharopine dehydrogenase (NAD+, L-lysine-forming)